MTDSLNDVSGEKIELGVIIVMSVVYFYIVNPILLDVAPFLAFQSSEGFDRRSGGLGPYSLAATVFVGIFIYYFPIKYTIEYGAISFFAGILLTVLVLIPNQSLPDKYLPGTIGQRDIEERLSDLISLKRNN